ncbi:hypothetical protein ACJIZ3_015307 [Penstemon smallii]|uniref:AIG1-type G domain-containing protein n=1 Tax=Penstemon smallii TaxID=265156 RepID=A0ABD3RM53_9LAMI
MENGIGIAKDDSLGERQGVEGEELVLSEKENLSLDAAEVFEETVEPETRVTDSDNRVGNVEDAELGGRQGVANDELELSKKENIDLSLDGDELFEEVVELEIPKIDSDNRVGNVELIGTLKNGDETSKLEGEIEKFGEVTGETDAVQVSKDPGAKVEFPISEEHRDEAQIVVENPLRDETNGLLDECNDKRVDFGESFDSASAGGEIDNLDNGDEVNKELSNPPQNPENGVSSHTSSSKNLTPEETKNLDADTSEEQIVEMSETLKLQKLGGAETYADKAEIERYIHEMAKMQDANEVNGGDIGSKKPDNGVLDHVNVVGTLHRENTNYTYADALKKQSQKTSFDVEDANGVQKNEAGPRPESESNGDVIHNDELNDMVNEAVAIKGSEHEQEKIENAPANQPLELKEDQIGVEEEENSISDANLEKAENTELKELDSESFKFQKLDSEIVDKEENKGIAVADTSTTDHVKESLVVENGTSQLLAESFTFSQAQLVDASTAVHEAVVVGPEKVGVKDGTKEYYISGNREHEVEPITAISSSAGLEHAAEVQEPVSQDKSIKIKEEQEIKPAADVSSSAKPETTPPAGLGHTAPLLAPAPQKTTGNRETGSRSAASVPSTNITSAAPARPAGLGGAAPLLEPTSRVAQQPRVNGAISPTNNQLTEDNMNGEAEEYDETREKLQMIRVKFLRLAHRLGQTPHNVVVAQVLYRLGLAEQLRGRSGSRVAAFSFDRASAMAEQLEAAGQEPLDFTCTIMVLGKSGVGKSATINSIFDEVMFGTDAFQMGTKRVQDIVGTVQGIRVRVIDTPGLLPSWSDQPQNEKILRSVKSFIKNTPPDIVLYLDRLDMQSRDFGEMPLLRTVTEIFGPSIWFNAIVVLTHAASAPPEGPNGTATSYDMFVTQRSHVVQQAIRQAAGDMRLMNPVSLVENHSACRTNRAGQRVLPNGQVWKPHLLLLSFASKILAEANTLLKLQDSPPGRPFAPRTRSPPLPFLLSSLLQSRPEIKLPSEQFGDDDDDTIDDDLDECSDSDDDAEYDELPPFKSLTKSQLEKLTKVQRKAYYDELEYREKLFMKKQLKEEKKRRKMMKKLQEETKDLSPDYGENAEEETNAAASVPVPMPDLALPASFDSDNPTHRYRSLDSSNPWLVRAVLEPNGWDHDIGYDGINVERVFVVKNKVPISFSGHVSKDKKDANLQMEVASSVKHGKGKSTSLGFDMQSVGKDMAYTLRSETRLSNHRINKAAAGFSATLLGDILTGGLKLEDKLMIGKRGQLVVSGGAIYGRGDVAYGGSLEATLKDKDHPLGRFLSTVGVSIMDWHGDLAIGCNSQTQIPIGRHTNLIGRFNITNKGSGQVSVRLNSSEQLQIILVGLIPLVKKLLGQGAVSYSG